jgi:acyl-CoA synthetase (AMP-forming)/AMP-acid ligase II
LRHDQQDRLTSTALLLQDILTERTAAAPDRIAIVAGRSRLTYGALAAMSDGLAAEFQRRGIGRGDRVAIFSDNWSESVVAALAALKAGAIACPVHPLSAAESLASHLRAQRARAVVTEARLATVAAAAIRMAESVRTVVLAGTREADGGAPGCIRFEDAVASRDTPARSDAADSDIAFLLAEDRSGEPFGASLLRHRDVIEAMEVRGRDGDAVITSLRLATKAGLCQLFSALRHGVTLMHSTSGAADVRPMAVPEAERPLRSTR